MSNSDEIRLRLIEAMDLNGLSQNQVGKESGVHQSILSRFIRGGGMSAENSERVVGWLDGHTEPEVPSTTEIRRAIRLYRYFEKIHEDGGTLQIKYADGTSQALLILW